MANPQLRFLKASNSRLVEEVPAHLRLEWLDALRGLAICMVIAVHTAQYISVPEPLRPVFREGARGVQLFFAISGFTMMLSLDRYHADEWHRWSKFAVRRIFRIVPLYWAAAVIWFLGPGGEPHYWSPEGSGLLTLALTLLFLSNWIPTMHSAIVPGGWSIAGEMNMYALMPLFLRATHTFSKAIIWFAAASAAAVILSAGGYFLLSGLSAHPELVRSFFNSYWLPVCLPSFIAGIAAYRAQSTLTIGRKTALLLLTAATLLFLCIAYTGAPLKSVLVAPVFGVAVFATAFLLRGLHVPRVVTWIGKTSYSSYFIHFGILYALGVNEMLLFALQALPYGWLLTQILVLVLTVCFASVSYLLFEQPINRYGAVIASHIQQFKPVKRCSCN